MLQKVDMHIVPWVIGGCSELTQLGLAVLFFCSANMTFCSSVRWEMWCFSHCKMMMMLSVDDPAVFPWSIIAWWSVRNCSSTKIEGSSSERSCGSFTSPSSSLVASFPDKVTLSFSFLACLLKRKRDIYPRSGYCVRFGPCCVSYRDYKREREISSLWLSCALWSLLC